jgi:hypothetical protein
MKPWMRAARRRAATRVCDVVDARHQSLTSRPASFTLRHNAVRCVLGCVLRRDHVASARVRPPHHVSRAARSAFGATRNPSQCAGTVSPRLCFRAIFGRNMHCCHQHEAFPKGCDGRARAVAPRPELLPTWARRSAFRRAMTVLGADKAALAVIKVTQNIRHNPGSMAVAPFSERGPLEMARSGRHRTARANSRRRLHGRASPAARTMPARVELYLVCLFLMVTRRAKGRPSLRRRVA